MKNKSVCGMPLARTIGVVLACHHCGAIASSPAARRKCDSEPQTASVTRRQCDTDGGPAPEHPPLHGRAVHVPQDDRDHRGGRLRQRPGHQRAGAVLRSGVAAARFARRPGQEGTIRWRWSIRPTSRPPSAPIARRSPPRRPTAGWPTWTRICSSTTASPSARRTQAETDAANAEADRDAALQALVSLNVEPQIHQGHPAGPAGCRASRA